MTTTVPGADQEQLRRATRRLNPTQPPVLPETAFGLHAIIDLHECDAPLIGDESTIRLFNNRLLVLLGMEPYGEPFLERFALHDPVAAGYTLIQPITTSAITAHFSESTRGVYLDVFSCRTFVPAAVAKFAAEAFNGRIAACRVLVRGV